MGILITAEHGRKSKTLGAWIGRTDGRFGELNRLANEAAQVLKAHWQLEGMVHADERRSEMAKREDIRADAGDRLRDLGQITQKMLTAKAEAEHRAAILAKVPDYNGNTAQVLIDLAIADRMRSMDAGKMTAALLSGNSPDLLRVALRLPEELTGVSPALRGSALRAEIFRTNPAEAQAADDEVQAIDAVRHVLQNAWRELAVTAGVGLDDQTLAAGSSEAMQTLRRDVHAETVERIAGRVLPTDADQEQSGEEPADEAAKERVEG